MRQLSSTKAVTKMLRLLIVAVALTLVLGQVVGGLAHAQKPAAPAKPDMKRGKRGKMRLPAGHPPVGKPAPRRPKAAQQQRVQRRLNALRRRAAAGKKKVKYPRDAHGHCLGQGAENRPKDINLVHGWFMVDNEQALAKIKERPRYTGWKCPTGTLSCFLNIGAKLKEAWPLWSWRMTPSMYRYENHDDHCDPKNQPIPLAVNLFNMALLLWLLTFAGKKPMAEALLKRRENIRTEIEQAQKIKKGAEKRLSAYTSEMDNLEGKLAELRQQYALEADTEEARLEQELQDTRRRLLADADFRLSQADKMACENLSREALEEALQAAEALLVANLNASDHERLEQEHLQHMAAALASDELGANRAGEKA